MFFNVSCAIDEDIRKFVAFSHLFIIIENI